MERLMNGSSASQEGIAGAATSSAPAKIRITVRERVESRVSLDQLLRGLQTIAETVFYIGVGAVRTAWEGIGKLWATARDTGAIRPMEGVFLSKPRPRSVRIKVPVLPIDNYSSLTADEVVKRLDGLSPDQLEFLRSFETEHKNRKTVLEAVNRMLAKGEQ
jgi:hypothetical protein